jgi:hypothetical protein
MGTEQSMTTASRIEELVAELDFTTKDLRDLSRDQKNGMEGLTGFSAGAIAHLYDTCKEALTRLKPVLEENERLRSKVETAAVIFEEYGRLHLKKGTRRGGHESRRQRAIRSGNARSPLTER